MPSRTHPPPLQVMLVVPPPQPKALKPTTLNPSTLNQEP